MNRSESIANLAAALVKAQSEFPQIPRSKAVSVTSKQTGATYSFSYAPFEDILRLTRDARLKNGLAFTQSATSAELFTTIIHESGEFITNTVPVYISSAGAQAIGSAVSYARRYGFCEAFGIQADDDDDGSGAELDKKSKKNTASATMKEEYDALAPDERVWIDDIAAGIKSWVSQGKTKEAIDEMDHSIPYVPRANSKDVSYKLALQSRLDSKTLTALKKARAEMLGKAA